MTRREEGPGGAGRGLEPREVETLRGMLGKPGAPRIRQAVEEIERQVATDDMIVLMMAGLSGAARVFFDVLAQIGAERDAPSSRRRREGDEP